MIQACECGHAKKAHIYEEGSCRPGFVCEKTCEKYTPTQPKITKITETERKTKEMNNKLLKLTSIVITALTLAALIGLQAYVFEFLWNVGVSPLGVPSVDFWQAVALTQIPRILIPPSATISVPASESTEPTREQRKAEAYRRVDEQLAALRNRAKKL